MRLDFFPCGEYEDCGLLGYVMKICRLLLTFRMNLTPPSSEQMRIYGFLARCRAMDKLFHLFSEVCECRAVTINWSRHTTLFHLLAFLRTQNIASYTHSLMMI
jgi:hypothetical protein